MSAFWFWVELWVGTCVAPPPAWYGSALIDHGDRGTHARKVTDSSALGQAQMLALVIHKQDCVTSFHTPN